MFFEESFIRFLQNFIELTPTLSKANKNIILCINKPKIQNKIDLPHPNVKVTQDIV